LRCRIHPISKFPLLYPMPSQIKRCWKLCINIRGRHMHGPRCVSERKETRNATRFGFVGVHGKCLVITAAGMSDMIRAAPNGALSGGIDDIEYEWSVHRNRRM